MTGRPSKINTKVTLIDPEDEEKREELSLTDAFVRMLEAGCYIGHICQMCGISEKTLSNWRARGNEFLDSEGEVKEGVEPPESELPFVQFVQRTVVAEGHGITWHERNIRRGAVDDPRLSLYFLERRRPGQYGRRLKVETEEERVLAPVDPLSTKEIEESFDAAHLPEGIEAESILPQPD